MEPAHIFHELAKYVDVQDILQSGVIARIRQKHMRSFSKTAIHELRNTFWFLKSKCFILKSDLALLLMRCNSLREHLIDDLSWKELMRLLNLHNYFERLWLSGKSLCLLHFINSYLIYL